MAEDNKDNNQDWSGVDDQILVKAHLKGDQRAFQVLFKKYRDMVARLVFSIVKDESLVEDISQDVFVLIYKNLPKFRGDSALKTWIYRIAVNESLRGLSRAKRWTLVEDPETEFQKFPSTIVVLNQGGDSPERLVLEGERREMVQSALEELKPAHRVALTLYYMEDMDVREMSEVLEIPEGSVKSRLYYAREGLKKALEPMLQAARTEGKENHVL